MPNYIFNHLVITSEKKTDFADLKEKVSNVDSVFSFDKIIPMPKSMKVVSGSVTTPAIVYAAFQQYRRMSSIPGIVKIYIKSFATLGLEQSDRIKVLYEEALQYRDSLPDVIPEHGPDVFATIAREDVCEYSKVEFDALGKLYLRNIIEHGCASWYEWRRRIWGCKWDAGDAQIVSQTDTSLEYRFTTPYSAPWNVIQVLSRLYPKYLFEIAAEEEDGKEKMFFFKDGTVKPRRN